MTEADEEDTFNAARDAWRDAEKAYGAEVDRFVRITSWPEGAEIAPPEATAPEVYKNLVTLRRKADGLREELRDLLESWGAY